MKKCSSCEIEKRADEFYSYPYQSQCKTCVKARTLRHYHAHSERINAVRMERNRVDVEGRRKRADSERLRRTGVTRATYDALFAAQGGRCAICGSTDAKSKNGGDFHVDHDHACCPTAGHSCGKCIRGLLCSPCNVAVRSEDWLVAALAYVRSFNLVASQPKEGL